MQQGYTTELGYQQQLVGTSEQAAFTDNFTDGFTDSFTEQVTDTLVLGGQKSGQKGGNGANKQIKRERQTIIINLECLNQLKKQQNNTA